MSMSEPAAPRLLDRVRAAARLRHLSRRTEKSYVALMGVLLYGAGLRLLECARLRVKDVDFGRGQLVVRAGKGDRDRATLLPVTLRPALQSHLERVRRLHEDDLRSGAGWI